VSFQITLFPGYLFIPLIIFGKAVESNSYAVNRSHPIENNDWNYPEFEKRRPVKISIQHYNGDDRKNITLKRAVKTLTKPSVKILRHKNKHKTPRQKSITPRYADDNTDNKNYHTFEEIHEHIEEDDGHYQASEQIGTQSIQHEHGKDYSNKKEGKRMKIKIKHHHHHHHHNHIKELIKTVPQPYPVEKIVHVPIEKIVEKIVHVPKLVNVTVEKIVHVPIEKIVEKVVHVPKPVQVPKPYVVEKIIEKIIHVPKPYPVLRTVPYPVEIKVPIPMEKKIPVPYKVEIERKVPIYIRSSEPYKFEPSPFDNYHRGEDFKFQMEIDHSPPQGHEPSSLPSYFYNKIYKSKNVEQPPRVEGFQRALPSQYGPEPITKSTIGQETTGRGAESFKYVDHPPPKDFEPSSLPSNYYNRIYKPRDVQPPQRVESFQDGVPSHYKPETVTMSTIEQNITGRDAVSLKLVGPTPHFNITSTDLETANSSPSFVNTSTLDLNPQETSIGLRGFPLALPFRIVQLQPMAFQSPINVDLPVPSAATEGLQK
ncbi:hypothetical protein KR009_006179, partial [Drosophila setifemur]